MGAGNYREQNVLEEVRRITARRVVDVVMDHVGGGHLGDQYQNEAIHIG